ncbi:chemotaxis protein CheW [Kordiimonas pumila]|uniref:Chemotaxis protein CheW n=1 Tax=Kordiimonas pumila TaxID=2161677 RepID=A0ABV7D0Z1_9PROT|nr:chemotaxis protein CheW [Kordiimonas pumila]
MTEQKNIESAVPKGFDPRLLGLETANSGQEVETGKLVQFVSFRVDESEYGIDIMAVREIQGWVKVTTLPNTPEYVRGVLNLRGIIVPIFDLRCRFGHGLTTASPLHVVIIVAVGERIMGLLVDAVSDILTINTEEILPVPEVEARSEQRFLDGLITVHERMVALLKIERLFDIEKIVANAGKAAS